MQTTEERRYKLRKYVLSDVEILLFGAQLNWITDAITVLDNEASYDTARRATPTPNTIFLCRCGLDAGVLRLLRYALFLFDDQGVQSPTGLFLLC